MHMIRSVIIGENPKKDIKHYNISSQWKHSNQQNKTHTNSQSFKHSYTRMTQGIGLSLKSSQNKESQIPTTKQGSNSQQLFDLYLQKVMKSNQQKMTQIRIQYEKQAQSLNQVVKSLKIENLMLNSRIQQLNLKIIQSQQDNNKQRYNLSQKKLKTYSAQKGFYEPNPQKLIQNSYIFQELKRKTEKLQKQNESYKLQNSILQHEIKKQKNKLQQAQNQQEKIKKQNQNLKKQSQNLKNQIKKIKNQKQKLQIKQNTNLETQKNISTKSSLSSFNQSSSQNLNNKSASQSNFVDKRLVKHIQIQLKQRQNRLYQKDRLIDELNMKIMSTGLSGISTKYKYLMKI